MGHIPPHAPAAKAASVSPTDHRKVGRRPVGEGVILFSRSGTIPLGADQMAIGIGRRQFIAVLGGAAASWPFAARAQQPAMPMVGILNSVSPDTLTEMLTAFRRGLTEIGFDEGRNVMFEYRWAEGFYDRLPTMAADLIQRQASVIVATGDAHVAVKTATTTIPIVFVTGADPVEMGLVRSLNKPGGNVTGVSWYSNPVLPKRLGMLRDLVPELSVIGALVNPKNPSAEIDIRALQSAADMLKLRLEIHRASTFDEITEAFASMAQQGVGAILVGADSFFVSQRAGIVALEARYALPASHPIREFVVAGGLMSYAPDRRDSFRVAGTYVGRILRGERPADLPVQLPTRFELAINLKTAKALGLTIPQSLLATADEVIE